ncbi:heat shock 70 kDa protein 12A-like isoform X2 [Saccostrea echinata]|uniref:heat shock 70 kDa protein 12A-like isoform X2 n=1 Tax=Saccostrea echinata TaxID=191078 RepID=UPI002A83055D|nr:heat shock 70 kDa protein 12A-like isoform X2 [Saccostrea echinata]
MAENWNLFGRFKMSLYEQQTVLDSLELVADNGKKMPAIKVFSASIKYLSEQLIKEIIKQVCYTTEKDVKWVITVPAIWSQPAKSFIRKAAIMAGIESEMLTIALEPEAAAICLKHLPLEKKKLGEVGDNYRTFSPGSSYIIVDSGGGTIDITTHEVLEDGSVKELFQSSGGDWGGTKVNDRIMQFFEDVLGSLTMSELRQNHQLDILELERNIETAKRSLSTHRRKMTITIPAEILDQYKKIHHADLSSVKSATLRDGRTIEFMFSSGKLRMDHDTSCSFFEESINSICDHLRNMFPMSTGQDIDTIIMVGGFANCSILIRTILIEFPDKHVLVPEEAEWSVLKGAVIFGHDPWLIKQRRSRYTYGAKCKKLFKEGEHDAKKKVEENGKVFCQDLFSKHVEIGELITVGEYQTNKKYRVSHESMAKIQLYASRNPDPKYVTDEGCFKIGELEICSPELEVGSKTRVQLSFSHTEIEARLSHRKSGTSSALYLDTNF